MIFEHKQINTNKQWH